MDFARFRDGFGHRHVPWNRGRLLGQKPPLKLKEIWAIRIRLQLGRSHRDLALFNLAIDSKLRGCDLVALNVDDVATPGVSRNGQAFASARQGGRYNSRLLNRPVNLSRDGLKGTSFSMVIVSFPARSTDQSPSLLDNMLASFPDGLPPLG